MTWMKKTVGVGAAAALTMFALSLSAVPEAAAAITLKSRISSTSPGFVVIKSDSAIGFTALPTLKFKFATPEKGEYKIRFCFGPAADPCGGANAYTLTLGAEDERLAVIDTERLFTGVLFVRFEGGQAEVDPIPFEVTIE